MPRSALKALLLICALASGCAEPVAEPQKTIDDAVAALGGVTKINSVRQLQVAGEGKLGNLGQDLTPEAATQTFTVTGYKRSFDIEKSQSRIEQTRTPDFVYFQGQDKQTLVTGIDGEVGYNIGANGATTRTTNVAARERLSEMYQHPLTLLQVALEGSTLLANPRTEGSERLVDMNTNDGFTYTLAIDASSHLPTRIQTKTDQPNLGDVVIETKCSDYVDVDGLKLPSHLVTTTDGVMTSDIKLSSQTVNGAPFDIAAPAAAKSAAVPGTPAPAIAVTEVAPGVWWLAGQSHHSVVVEFADHLTLIEVPQSEARTLAVIAKARELRPDKPLTEAISTHHHFDHSAGLRAAVSQGLTIIAQAKSEAFYTSAAQRPHTIAPDVLAKAPKPIAFRAVGDDLTLSDTSRSMTLYHITGSAHADTMLVAYLPRERVLVEADLFTPGATVNAFAGNLQENINRLGLRIDRIVPLHGVIAPYTDLPKATHATTN